MSLFRHRIQNAIQTCSHSSFDASASTLPCAAPITGEGPDAAAQRAARKAAAEACYTASTGAHPVCSFKASVSDYSARDDKGNYPKKVEIYEVEERYTGRVVRLGVECDVRVMSDVWDDVPYAIVYTEGPDGAISFDRVSTYDGPGYCEASSWAPWDAFRNAVDAPAEIIALYDAREAAAKEAARKAEEERRAARLVREAEEARKRPTKGQYARVTKGRKVPHGTIVLVQWIGETRYGVSSKVRLDDGTEVWIDPRNLERDYTREAPAPVVTKCADCGVDCADGKPRCRPCWEKSIGYRPRRYGRRYRAA